MFPVERYESVREGVSFLARSPNRVRVLDTLTDGPVERRELAEACGASKATISRTLAEFERRGWASSDGRAYETTQLGELVVREFTGLLEGLEPVGVLADVARWFPDDGFDFDLRRLADADVVRATRTDALAPTTRMVRRLERASRVLVLSYAVLPSGIETNWRRTVDGEQRVTAVLSADAVDAIAADDTLADRLHEMIRAGAAIYRYPGDVPYVVVVTDDVVSFVLFDDSGAPHAIVASDDGGVRSQVESTVESYRTDADRLDAAAFAT